MSQSKLSSAPQGPSSTERAVSPPDAVKSTVSPVTSRTGKRLPDEEFTSHDQEATVPVDAALTAEAQRDDEATAPVDAASATGEAPSAQESSALAVETAAASPTNSNLSKLGLGALALVGLAAAVAGGGGDSKGKPQVPSQPSGDDGKPQVPSQPSGDAGKPQVPSQPSGSDSKPPPVQVPGVGTKPINGQGVVTVSGVVDGAEWEFSLDDGDTWHKGDGNGVSASDLVEGPNTITIVQTDKDGNRSDAVVVVVIKDSIIEKPVLGTSTGTGAINDTGSISVGGIENNGKWEFSVDRGQTWRPGTGGSISGAELNEGDNTVIVKQTDEAGSVATATIDVVKDSIIEKPVLGTSTGTGAINDTGSISVGGIENNGKWEFSVDGGQTWRPGTGGSISGAELNEGDNTVTVKQTDEAGNVATATIDVVKDSIIDKPVLGTSTGTGAINDTGSISVGGIENNGKWEFSVDGGQTWKPGTGGSISGAELNEGDNTVTVKQTDEAGNVATATIDVVKDSIIEKPVLGTSTGTGAINDAGSISVGGIENNGKWEFSVDGGQTWRPGTGGSISGAELNEGDNTVTVKQTDEAGNVATATIDVVKDSLIEKPVLGASTGTGAINDTGSISVGGIENNGKWEFSVDGGQTWRPGTGGSISGAELNEGDNTVIVKQTDEAGNVATATIDVVKDSIIDKPVLGTSTGTGAINDAGSISVGGIENNGKWEFSVDGGQTWRPGTGGSISGAELNEGDNTVIVKQTDEAGNVATAIIDVVKDSIIEKPVLGTSTGTGAINDTGSISVGDIENNGKWEFSVDGGQTWKPGTGGSISGAELNEGDNTVIVKQTDEAGNVATATIDVVKDSIIDKPVLGTSTGTGAINDTGSISVGGIENNGKWEFSVDGGQTWRPGTGGAISGVELKEGDNTVTVKQTDAAGNVATATITVVKDTLIDKPIVGTSTGTGSINNTGSVTVSGIESNGKWEFSVDGGQTWKPGTGGSISGADLREGDNTVTVKQTDEAGNVATATIDVVKDSIIEKPVLGTSTGTGAINDAGSISVGGIENNGKWEFSVDGGQTWRPGTGGSISGAELNEGDNTVTVKQTDEAGNVATATIDVVKDSIIDKPVLGTSTGTGAINDAGSISVGGIENNGKWEFSVDGGQTWKPGTGGSISGAELNEGDNTVTVKQTDAAGNVATASITVVKDTLIDRPIVGTSTGTGSINNTGSVTVSGIENNGKWEFSVDGGQTWRPGTGGAISGAELNEGDNTVIVKQTDEAGNVATATIDVVKDSMVDQPTITTTTGGAINDTGWVNVGKLEDGARWEYSVDGGKSWTQGQDAKISGAVLTEGPNTITIKQTDIAGNVGTAVVTVEKDTTVAGPTLALDWDTGKAGDRLTYDGLLNVGEIEKDARWEYSIDGGAWTTGSGATIGDPGYVNGPHIVQVRQTDLAGNTSATVSLTFTIDKLAPSLPVASLELDSGVPGDLYTNASTLLLSGLEVGGSVFIETEGKSWWIHDVASSSGRYSLPAFSSDGPKSVRIRQADQAANQSATQVFNFTLDTKAPDPVALSLLNDTGVIGDARTSDATIRIAGREWYANWQYSLDGGQSWTASSGDALSGRALSEGVNTVTIVQIDRAGNVGASSSIAVHKDTLVDVPTITTATGGAINDTGWVHVGGLESGAKWAYSLDNGKTWIEGTDPKIPGSALKEGDNTLIIRQTDLAGNSASSTVLVVKDIVAAAPTLSLAIDSGAVGDRLTNSGVLNVSGIEAGSHWEYSIDGADWQEGTGRTIADPGYANVSHTVRVRQTDLAGNTSATASLTFTIDKLAPSVPVVSLELDSGEPDDLYTSASNLLLSGLEVGGAVFLETEGRRWSSHDLASSSMRYWLPAFSSDGPKSVLISQADKAGNQSATRSFFFTLDTKAPDPVALSLATDSGAAGDRLTNSGVLDVSGIEAGARWEYSIDGANWQEGTGRTIADPGYANATHTVRVRQTDIAGNRSAESTFTFTIDKAAPVTPQVSLRYDGGSSGNPLTNSPDLKLSGLEVGSKIHVFKEGQWYVYEAHAETGFFHLPGFASDGPKTVLVKQVDAAGNESATASFDFTLDTRAPDAVDLSLVNDTGVAGDGRTSDATIKLSGLESDATWKYSLDGGITWTTGAGQAIAGSALNEGANMVTVAQIDRAGNLGASSSITVHKDTLVVAPTIKMPAAGSKAEFDASEEGFAYVVSASAADTSSMAALDALPPDQCHRLDVAAGGRVELSALSGLSDGYYRVVFSDKAGNLAAATTAGGMKHVQVQGGEILSTQVVMGTSGNDVLTAPNGGGAMISGDGFDTFVFSSGIKGVFDVDLHAMDTLDLRSLGLDKDRFFLEREQRFQRGTHQGKAAILIDWEATGDFTNPDVVLVSATASNPSVLYDDNGTGRMFPF